MDYAVNLSHILYLLKYFEDVLITINRTYDYNDFVFYFGLLNRVSLFLDYLVLMSTN